MDSLQDILGKKAFTPPDEMSALKDYIQRKYQSRSSVRVEKGVIILAVPNSGLAATLQLEKSKLIEVCGIKSRLIIRVGR